MNSAMMSPISDRRVNGMRRAPVAPVSDHFSAVHAIAPMTQASEGLNLEAVLEATNEQLAFHRLIADVAARFGAIAPEDLDDAIVDSLRQTAEALLLDWAVLWRRTAGEAMAVPTHYWVDPTVVAPKPVLIASIPSAFAGVRSGDTRCFGSVDELPEGDREAFRRCGLRSAVMVPLPPTGEEGVFAALAYGSTTQRS